MKPKNQNKGTKMKSKKPLMLPIVVAAVLVVSSFMPIIQVLILTLNGAIVHLIGKLLETGTVNMVYSTNLLLSIVFVVLFYLSNSFWVRLLNALLTIIFLFPLLFYSTENIVSDSMYFLPFMVVGLFSGGILIGVAFIKLKMQAVD